MEPSLKYTNNPEFLKLSQYFDQNIVVSGDNTDPNSIMDTLHIYDTAGKTGPQLTLPSSTLNRSTEFTVEVWFAVDQFVASNFSVIGISGRPWDKGFGIGGLINSTGASVACIMDNVPTPEAKMPCNIRTHFCQSIAGTRVWTHLACSRTGPNTGRMIINEKVITETISFTTNITDLFEPGNLVLGMKDTGKAGFNGYIRDLRIWTRFLTETEVLGRMRDTLEPMDHGSLAAYWPLTGGRTGDFFDISGTTVNDVTIDTTNPAGRAAFGVGSHEWLKMPSLWSLQICRKGYFFNPATATCMAKKEYQAIYTKLGTIFLDASGIKTPPQTWGTTFAIWVYHDFQNYVLSNKLTLIGIKDHIMFNMTLTQPGGVPTGTLDSTYGTYSPTSYNLGGHPSNGKWIHYGLVTDDTTGTKRIFYINGEAKSSIDITPPAAPALGALIIFFASSLQGYARDAKIWTRPLQAAEFYAEKH